MVAKAGKREAPAKVPPVTVDGVRYEVLHYGKREGLEQNGGYVIAKDAETGKELRKIKIYDVSYDPNGKEMDSQDVFITKMSKAWLGPRLNIKDEHGRSWTLHLDTGTVTP